jgi:hypothetical protein
MASYMYAVLLRAKLADCMDIFSWKPITHKRSTAINGHPSCSVITLLQKQIKVQPEALANYQHPRTRYH